MRSILLDPFFLLHIGTAITLFIVMLIVFPPKRREKTVDELLAIERREHLRRTGGHQERMVAEHHEHLRRMLQAHDAGSHRRGSAFGAGRGGRRNDPAH